MRFHRWTPLLLVLVVPALLAGCAGPQGAEANTPPSGGGPGPQFTGPAGFTLEGPTILPLDGRERALREDDGAIVRYTLRQPADAPNASTALVSLLLGGKVEDVQSVTLAPGESKEFEHRIDAVRNLTEVRVEVRAGGTSGKAAAPVQPWPRPGEWLAFGDYFNVNVGSWARDETTSETVVHITLTRGTATFSEFRSHALCLDPATGAVESKGVSRPDLQPMPNGAEAIEMRLPLCEGETYGVDFKADVGPGQTVYGRVLFVPPGWAPPTA